MLYDDKRTEDYSDEQTVVIDNYDAKSVCIHLLSKNKNQNKHKHQDRSFGENVYSSEWAYRM